MPSKLFTEIGHKLKDAIKKELSRPSTNSGYWKILPRSVLKHGGFVPRETVMYTLKKGYVHTKARYVHTKARLCTH